MWMVQFVQQNMRIVLLIVLFASKCQFTNLYHGLHRTVQQMIDLIVYKMTYGCHHYHSLFAVGFAFVDFFCSLIIELLNFYPNQLYKNCVCLTLNCYNQKKSRESEYDLAREKKIKSCKEKFKTKVILMRFESFFFFKRIDIYL